MPVATKKHRSNPEWIHRHLTDPYVKLSRQKGYRARSAFKLIEINDIEKFLKPGVSVVDLGAAPGSWSQVVREKLAGKDGKIQGKIVAIDILPMEPIDSVTFVQGDFREESVLEALEAALETDKVDVVLSDMAPNLSGIAASDAARSALLNELALEFCEKHLAKNGIFVIKVFQGSGFSQYVRALKDRFTKVTVRKPAASRDTSAEVYLVARGLKQAS
ncbi:MAG TPA: rRNA methyltransferase [Sutterella sp.]|nr:rRNA methyltransferase [Sutterella sp.]